MALNNLNLLIKQTAIKINEFPSTSNNNLIIVWAKVNLY